MFEKIHQTSYDLIRHMGGNFSLIGADGTLFSHGSLNVVVKYMVANLDFDIDQIEYAVEQLEDNDHLRAHFGCYRKFIFTDTPMMQGVA
jgi:hypothetical protein